MADVHDVVGQLERLLRQARSLGAEQQQAAFGEAVGLHGHRAVDDVHGDHLGVLRNVQVVPRVHQFAGGVSGTQHAGLGRRLRRLDALARLGAFLCDARVPIVHAGANRRVMHHMLVQLGHERAFAVPFVRTHDVHAVRREGIRRAHH